MTEENETVSFRKDERMRYGVLGYDGNEMMAAITGCLSICVLSTRWQMRKPVPMLWPMSFTKH